MQAKQSLNLISNVAPTVYKSIIIILLTGSTSSVSVSGSTNTCVLVQCIGACGSVLTR